MTLNTVLLYHYVALTIQLNCHWGPSRNELVCMMMNHPTNLEKLKEEHFLSLLVASGQVSMRLNEPGTLPTNERDFLLLAPKDTVEIDLHGGIHTFDRKTTTSDFTLFMGGSRLENYN